MRKVHTLFSLFLVTLLALSIFQFASVKAPDFNYWIEVNLSKNYGYRGDGIDVTVRSNSSGPRLIILDPTNATVYDRIWGVNETRAIPILGTSAYGVYFVKALAGKSISTAQFTVLEVFPWDIISTPYTRVWKGINYTFLRDEITARFYNETLNVELRLLRELVVQFNLIVSASYDKNRFRVTLSRSAISINLTYTFNDLGCKLTIDGQLDDQPRQFTFRFENLTKVKRVRDTIHAAQLFFDFGDIAKLTYAFEYDADAKELSVSVPQSFSLDPLISFDAVSSAQGEGPSLSWSHTTSLLSNRLLLVGASLRNSASQTVSTVTYGGVSLNFLRADTNGVNARTEIWYLANPAVGTKTIAITFSASLRAASGAITLLGVNQTNPFTNNDGATGTSTSPSASVTSAADDWLLGVLGTKGIDNLQDFIDQISDMDSHPDHGTHSDFTKEQTAPDTVYDTLTEADTDTGTSTFGKTSGSGVTYRTTAADEVRLGVFTAATSGEVASIVFYGRAVSATNAKAIITDSSGNLLTNGVGAATAVSATAGIKTLTYTAGSRPIVISGTTYWIGFISQAAIRLYYDSATGGTSKQDTSNSYTTPTSPTDAGSTTETWRLMYANINNLNYELDLEQQWITADYSQTNEELCIKTGSLNAENLKVEVRTGGTWTTVINPLVASQWNNASVSAYLTTSTFTMRFIGATETGDTLQGTWQIDSVLLHTWSASLTITEGSGQTNRWNLNTGEGTTNIYGVGSTKGPVTSGLQSISWTLSTSSPWAVSIASVKKISGTELFSDGFESNDYSAWSGTVGSAITTSSTLPHHGTYSSKSAPTGLWENNYPYIYGFGAYDTQYVRFYVNLGSVPSTSTSIILANVITTGWTDLYYIYITKTAGGVLRLELTRYVPSTVTTTYDYTFLPNTPYSIEVKFLKSATGEYRVYLDGAEVITDAGIDTSSVSLHGYRLGSPMNSYSFGAMTGYLDCVVVSDTYIGPEITAQNYIADLSQAITSTWAILTKTDFKIISSQALTASWNILAKWVANLDISQGLTTAWQTLTQWKAIIDLTQSLLSTWQVLTPWNAITDLSQAITSSWTVLTQTTFNIVDSLSTTFSWVVDITHTLAGVGVNYVVDLSQAILFTWNTILQWSAITDFAQSLTTSWSILLQATFNIQPSLTVTTSWIVDIIQGLQYSADLTLTVTTTWIVDIIHTIGVPVAISTSTVSFALIALVIALTALAYSKRNNSKKVIYPINSR